MQRKQKVALKRRIDRMKNVTTHNRPTVNCRVLVRTAIDGQFNDFFDRRLGIVVNTGLRANQLELWP